MGIPADEKCPAKAHRRTGFASTPPIDKEPHQPASRPPRGTSSSRNQRHRIMGLSLMLLLAMMICRLVSNWRLIPTNTETIKRKIAFVHLGKTAGSTITCMIGPSLEGSGRGDSGCEDSDYRASAIAHRVAERFHVVPAPSVDEYQDFLVTLRNPVERIVSWFYFVHPSYQPRLTQRHIDKCHGYQALFECYDTMEALGAEGLLEIKDRSSCQALAEDTISGQNQCWHNTYNYEYTYGDLVRNVQKKQQLQQQQAKPQSNSVTIYAIRTEHLEEDWSVIDTMLGGSSRRSSSSNSKGVLSPRKNSWNTPATKGISDDPQKTLSPRATSNLCRVLCDEIQIYKHLLRMAVNLDAKRENESLDELSKMCPEEGKEIRTCAS